MGYNNKEIESEICNLNELLLDNSSVFFIPEFQRSFVWNETDIEKLLNDFAEDSEDYTFTKVDKLPGYLLGNIVLIDNNEDDKKIVVDGQQRLTTISLIFKAINSVFLEKINTIDSENRTQYLSTFAALNKGYQIMDDDDNFEALKIQHDRSLSFGKTYRNIIRNGENIPESSSQADQNIRDVYDYIYSYLDGYDIQKLKKFTNYFKKKVKLIVTVAPTMSKAFQLFEVLNDRGRSLEPMDLIKNHFLKSLTLSGSNEEEIKDFNDNWKKFNENLFISKKKQISTSTFMHHYLMAFEGENVKQENLFDYFKIDKNQNYQGNQILKFAESIEKISAIYSSIEKGDYSAFSKDRNMNTIFRILKVKQMYPFLMRFCDENDDMKSELLDLLTRFSAAVIFSYTQTNFIEKTTTNLMKEYNLERDKEKAFKNLKQNLEEIIDSQASMAITLKERSFTSTSGGVQSKLTNLLKFIEYYYNENDEIIHPDSKKSITVEHILSRNIYLEDISKLGFADEEEKKKYLNRLGNLTLMYNTDNASIGNSSFKNKIPAYKNCNFRLTRTIVEPLTTTVQNGMDTKLYNKINKYEKTYYTDESENWNKELIEKRSEDLTNLFIKIVTKKAN